MTKEEDELLENTAVVTYMEMRDSDVAYSRTDDLDKIQLLVLKNAMLRFHNDMLRRELEEMENDE